MLAALRVILDWSQTSGLASAPADAGAHETRPSRRPSFALNGKPHYLDDAPSHAGLRSFVIMVTKLDIIEFLRL